MISSPRSSRLGGGLGLLLLGLLTLLTGGCQNSTGDDYLPSYSDRPSSASLFPKYTFAVHPLHNPQRLFAKYQPLLDVINEQARGFSLKMVASRDYPTFERKLRAGHFHFALPNPLQTMISQKHGYRIVGKMGDDDIFRGIIVMRRDSPVMFVEDLEGSSLSFPAPTALAATMMPKFFLATRGLDLGMIDIRYVGSQESAIMNVYLGKTVAAGTWPMPWEMLLRARPELGKVLEVRWMTPPLVNNGLVARQDVPESHVRQVMEVLLDLPNHARGREILRNIHISSFETADASTYDPVRRFLDSYTTLFPGEGLTQ